MTQYTGLRGRVIRFYEFLYGHGSWHMDAQRGEQWMHLMTLPLLGVVVGLGTYWWLI
ncbi:MAG: hypothetical protein JSW10_05915 [Pseudomonadota bacterium]|nr:MAG: hypothetical protein JSW10_05915 [Pseudomonadota bacterium]